MSLLIDEVCEYIDDHSTNFSYGSGSGNLKIGELVLDTNGVFVEASPSPQPDKTTAEERQIIDFTSRDPDSDRAYQLLREIYEIFHRRQNYETDNYHIYFSNALDQPMDLDRDAEGGKVWKLSVLFIYSNLNLIS